jgi:hypothetical protein
MSSIVSRLYIYLKFLVFPVCLECDVLRKAPRLFLHVRSNMVCEKSTYIDIVATSVENLITLSIKRSSDAGFFINNNVLEHGIE